MKDKSQKQQHKDNVEIIEKYLEFIKTKISWPAASYQDAMNVMNLIKLLSELKSKEEIEISKDVRDTMHFILSSGVISPANSQLISEYIEILDRVKSL